MSTSGKRKRIRVKVSELLKKIESKSSEPKHISGIIPDALKEWQNSLAKLELEMDAKSVEEYRTKGDGIVPNSKAGAIIYCGTGGVVDHEAIRIFMETYNK